MTRVEWSPDGTQLLAHRAPGAVRVLDVDGEVRNEIIGDMRILDARWDGELVATIDAGHRLMWWRADGRRTRTHKLPDAGRLADWASLSARAMRVAIDDTTPIAWDLHARRMVWGLGEHARRRHVPAAVALSDDGSRVAVADPISDELMAITVHVVDTNRELHADVVPARSLALAFDAEGRRVAYAAPMPAGPLGVVELGAGHIRAYPEHTAGADAVALDPHGAIAAFASAGRIRFDDVAGGGKLVLDIPHAPIAIAFSPDSRQLAYLTGDERIGVVPVP